jgi:cyclic pyranopterin phosphate synthase
MPGSSGEFNSSGELMTEDELLRLLKLATRLGFDRIRLTGGEPTVRTNLVSIVARIAELAAVKDIAMTTNGMQLERLAEPLARAGLVRVNISVDSLDADQFEKITRFGKFDSVWRGVLAAERAGLKPIKLNAVILRGYNENHLTQLAHLTLEHPWDMRFIEVMPVGSLANFQIDALVTVAEMKQRIEAEFGLEELGWNGHSPFRPYRLPGGMGTLGFISSVSDPFCAGCDRVRLTADGRLRLCLLRDDAVDLLTPMRAGVSDRVLLSLLRTSVYLKPWGHGLAEDVHPRDQVMSKIGG